MERTETTVQKVRLICDFENSFNQQVVGKCIRDAEFELTSTLYTVNGPMYRKQHFCAQHYDRLATMISRDT